MSCVCVWVMWWGVSCGVRGNGGGDGETMCVHRRSWGINMVRSWYKCVMRQEASPQTLTKTPIWKPPESYRWEDVSKERLSVSPKGIGFLVLWQQCLRMASCCCQTRALLARESGVLSTQRLAWCLCLLQKVSLQAETAS